MSLTSRRIYAVVFGNYYPREVDSLYGEEADARVRCDYLNDEEDTGMWRVEAMSLQERSI